ncbi:quinone-dependent dihydroorotate dehydrogenase [Methyloceanibacter sp.]|uniref:quinone-dependent dihydroorotate dehydrogenase n=1 Tax=Methyloceanibacter sp. TaxID=1965321 RepID=UPI002D6CED3F|nr:quinone-dependent dihydroorotate dehydrogenase [Methyloceanibacter sp.]HZP09324.1 quinone-dependent dihydroorotate dehydrogenase [Methyloceanibacter sp.]
MNGLFGFGQTLLLALDPERAHDLAVKSLELGLYPHTTEPDDKRLAQRIFDLDFPNPIGMAPGFDKNARVPRELLGMGFGFVEVGTLTPRPQSGNPLPRVFRSMSDRAVINRLGFNNDGQEAALARLKQRPAGIVGVNIGAGRDSPDRVADYVSGIERMGAVASYFTVNISSPNTPGLRDLQAPAALDALLQRVQAARGALPSKPPLLVKLAPDLADDDLPEVVGVIVANGADGIVVSNTTLVRDGLKDAAFAREAGGLSGRPLFARATRMLARVYKLTQGKLPLVGVGGIDSAETAVAKVEAGASLLQLYTGLVFEGPALIGRIKRALISAIERADATDLKPLIGRRAEEWAARSA